MQVLVTGGAGFIGSNLSERLLRLNHKVICVDNLNDYYSVKRKEDNIKESLKNNNYKFYKTDIEDKDNLKKIFENNKIDVVIHLAARAGVRASFENPEVYFKTNVIGTINILELCRYLKIKLIFSSSSSVYGNDKIPFSENDFCEEQLSFYGATKRIAERLCEQYSKIHGMKTICLRFFTVYGPRGRPDMAPYIFTKNILEGKEIKMFGKGDSKRDYTYVEDIVDGIIAAIKLDVNFEIINLGDSKPIVLRDFIEIIEKNTGKKAKIKQVKEQKGDINATLADISKAKKLLGYEPKVNVEEGIKRFVGWYNNNL